MPAKQFEIQNKGGKASIKLIGAISWWQNNSANFIAQVDDLIRQGCTDLDCYLNTPGGEMFEANEIGNQVSRFTGHKYCKLGALCASSGTIISTYFDEVVASANTQYMIHDPSVGLYIEHLSDFDSNKTMYENLRNDAINRYHDKTGIPIEELSTMLEKTTWMNAQTAKKKKFVDSISSDKSEMPDDAATLLAKFPNAPANIKTIITNSVTPPLHNMKEIAKSLGLPEDATEAEILAAIQRQKAAAEGATTNGIAILVKMAEKKGFSKETVERLAKADFQGTLTLISEAPEKEEETSSTTTANGSESVPANQTRLKDFVEEMRDAITNATPLTTTKMSFSQLLEKDKKSLKAMLDSTPQKVQQLYEEEYKYFPSIEDLKNVVR